MTTIPKTNDIHIYLRPGQKERLKRVADRELRRSLSETAWALMTRALDAAEPATEEATADA